MRHVTPVIEFSLIRSTTLSVTNINAGSGQIMNTSEPSHWSSLDQLFRIVDGRIVPVMAHRALLLQSNARFRSNLSAPSQNRGFPHFQALPGALADGLSWDEVDASNPARDELIADSTSHQVFMELCKHHVRRGVARNHDVQPVQSSAWPRVTPIDPADNLLVLYIGPAIDSTRGLSISVE